MRFDDIVKKARSIRSFKNSEKIDLSVFHELMELLRYTPSSSNKQALKYFLSYDDYCNTTIRENTKWAGLLKNYDGPEKDENPSAYVLIFIDTEISSNIAGFNKDVGICAQTINLFCRDREIGCCMIGSFNEEKILKKLNIDSDRYKLSLICALGYPNEDPVIVDIKNGDTAYYRDENNVHHVPKRTLDTILMNNEIFKER